MHKFKATHLITSILIFIVFIYIGCSDPTGSAIGPAPFPTTPVVFQNDFGSTVTFQAFLGSKLDAVQTAPGSGYLGTNGLVITVPDSGDVSGSYAGGAFTASVGRDLSGYNCLTFWVKASKAATMNVAGIGNDNTGTSIYTAEINNISLTTSWQKVVIPIPLAEKLLEEQGLFYFAEGPENGTGYTIWLDEIIFENLPTITNPRPSIPSQTLNVESGEVFSIGNGTVTFNVGGTDVDVSAMPAYFTFTSSNTTIVSVGADATFIASGVGDISLTAKLGTVNATGSIAVNVAGVLAVPTTPAPAPTVDPSDVVSLFSDTYTNVSVNLWSTDWDMTDLDDITIGSDSVKKYYNLSFAGIEFTSPTVDASAMTYFHIDLWTPNATSAPATFKVKLVDFGANGVFGGGDDSEHELTIGHSSLSTESWVSIDIPLISFSGLTSTANLAQLIISGSLTTVYLDNMYFYNGGQPTAPSLSAPTPAHDQADVVSLLSNIYTDVTVDTWSAVWDNATVADYAIGTDTVKQYTNFVVAGIDFRSSAVDGTSKTHLHLDLWTPNAISTSTPLKIKLVDFGPNGTYGGGDDIEDEITVNPGLITTALWSSIDIQLTDFTDLTTQGHIGQMILSGDLSTIFLENVYFFDSGIPTSPQTPAPTPALNAADVISLYSDAYSNVTVDTWSAPWDTADVANVMIGSDNVKRYSNLLFAGIEFTNQTIDASAMTHFHMDIWTPDPTDEPAAFNIKLVDFGSNGVWGGGDDVEHELTIDHTMLNSSSWVSLDIPLSQFVNLTTTGHLAQLIISGDPNTLYVDNVYFHK